MARIAGTGAGSGVGAPGVPKRRQIQRQRTAVNNMAKVDSAKRLLVANPWLKPPPAPPSKKPPQGVVKGAIYWHPQTVRYRLPGGSTVTMRTGDPTKKVRVGRYEYTIKAPPARRPSPAELAPPRPVPLSQQAKWADDMLLAPTRRQQTAARRHIDEITAPWERRAIRRGLVPPAPAPPPPSLLQRGEGFVTDQATGALEGLKRGAELANLPAAAIYHGILRRNALEQAGSAALHGVEALPGLTEQAGRYLGRQALSEAAAVAEAMQLRGKITDPKQQARVPAPIQQAGAIPTAPISDVGDVLLNVGAGAAGGVYAHRHPIAAARQDIHYIREGLVGVTQIPGMVDALTSPQISNAQRGKLAHEMWHALISDMIKDVGPNATLQDAFKAGEEAPMQAMGRLAAILDPEAGGVGVFTRSLGSLLRGGGRLARGESAFAMATDKTRTLRLPGPDGKTVEIPAAHSWIARNTIQRLYDYTSRGVERYPGPTTPVVGRLSTTRRALRAQRRAGDREIARLPAEAQAAMHTINRFVRTKLGRLKGPEALLLDLLHQKPTGYTNDEWLQAIHDNLSHMLESGDFEVPADVSAAMKRLETRANRFRTKADRARQSRRGRVQADIAKEQARLTKALDDLNGRRQEITDHQNALTGDTASRQQLLDDVEQRISALEAQRSTANPNAYRRLHDNLTALRDALHADVTNARVADETAQYAHMSDAELQAEVDAFDKKWEKLVENLRKRDAISKQDVARRNASAKKLARKGVVARTARQEAVARAEEDILNVLKNRADDPVVQQMLAAIERADSMRQELGRRADRALGIDEPTVTAAGGYDNLSGSERAAAHEDLNTRRQKLDIEANVIRQKLDEISLNEPAVSHAARDEWQQALAQLPNVSEAQAEDLLRLGDARAREYARGSGNDPGEWWAMHPVSLTAAEDIPLGTLAQRKVYPKTVEGIDNVALDREVKRVFHKYGKMSGALPPGVRGPQALGARARELARLVKKGEAGRHWYRDSGRAIRQVVGNDWDAAVKISMAVAYLSRTDSVQSNVGHALRAFRNYVIHGDVGQVGRYPNVSRGALNEIFKTGDWGGYKTNSFFRNILEEVDKAKYDRMFAGEEPATIDRWMVRALGFTDDNVGLKGRYKLVEDLTKEIGRQLGMTPKEAQAAAWVAVKAETEGTDIGAASFHIGTAIDRVTNSMRVFLEGVGNFPEYATWEPRVQQQFAREVGAAVQDYARQLRVPATAAEREANVRVGAAQREATIAKNTPAGEPVLRVTPEEQAFYNGYTAGVGQALDAPSMQWTRLMVPENAADRSAYFATADNLSADTLDTLRAANTDPRVQIHHGDGGVWFTLDKASDMTPREFANAVAKLVDDHLNGETINFAHEGQRVEGATYADEISNSGRPDEIRSASDQLSGRYADLKREFSDDPTGAAQRARRRELGRARTAGVEPPRLLNQARAGDLLGATEWIKGPAGQRVIYLTQNADVSTVLHELFGHAANEMKQFHPSEFERVEQEFGVPLEQWGVDEHETFARWAERYFATGVAPTAELVPVFSRMKTWMRTVYESIRRALGPAIPPATRDLFDHYFGGYSEENVMRTAANMGEETALHEFEAAAGVSAQARTEYESTKARVEAAAAKRTLQGKEKRLAELKALERDEGEPLSREEQLEQITLTSQVLKERAAGAIADDKREKNLRAKISDLEEAMKLDQSDPRFQAAQESLQWMARDRERILREAYGSEYDQMFSNRVDLLADWLVDRGFLQRGFDAPAGHTRLYRGEGEGYMSYADQGLIPGDETSYWTTNRAYAEAHDTGGGTHYVDVPDGELRQYASGDNAGNYELPGTIAAEARPVEEIPIRGSASYYPYGIREPWVKQLRQPAAALEGRVVGQTKALPELHKRNEMILWQRGDWHADPAVMFESYMRALGYTWSEEVRGRMWQMGRELTDLEKAGTTPLGDVYVLNKWGTPISPNLRMGIERTRMGDYGPGARPATDFTTTEDVQKFLDGLESADNLAMESSMESFWNNVIFDPNDPTKIAHLPAGWKQAHGLRVVDRHVVDALLRPLRGGRNAVGRAWDVAATLARWSLIYINAPGYWIVNGGGNLGFLFGQQGIFMYRSARYMKRLWKNPELLARIGGETGELPLEAAISRGRGGRVATQRLEQTVMHGISAVDRYPRAWAWMYEAEKRGYKTDADMIRLIEGKSAKSARDREIVAQQTKNHMIDFDRLNDWERNYVTRALFVYPWIRGAVAYPFWYAKNYPLRTAALLELGGGLNERRKRMLGNVPPWYEGLFPIEKHHVPGHRDENGRWVPGGDVATVVNASGFSPTQTAADEMRAVEDFIGGLAGQKPTRTTAALIDMFSPTYRSLAQITTGYNSQGKQVSLRDSLSQIPGTFMPGQKYLQGILTPNAPSIYMGNSRSEAATRLLIRVTPHQISIPRLDRQAAAAGQTTLSQRIDEASQATADAQKNLTPGIKFDQSERMAIKIKLTYEAQRDAIVSKMSKSRSWQPQKVLDQYGKPTGAYETKATLTPWDDAQVIYSVVKKFLPAGDIKTPHRALLNSATGKYDRPGSWLGQQKLKDYKAELLDRYAGGKGESILKDWQSEGPRRKAKSRGRYR